MGLEKEEEDNLFKRIRRKMKKQNKNIIIRRLTILDYNADCFQAEIWGLLTPDEQRDLLTQLAQKLKVLRGLFIKLARRIPK